MAYVRWSYPGKPHAYDSAVYIYDSAYGGIDCCGCLLNSDPEAIRGYTAADHDEMIDHVRKHIEAGHAVPDFVIPRLEEARDEENE
jgi:hypothetical protein